MDEYGSSRSGSDHKHDGQLRDEDGYTLPLMWQHTTQQPPSVPSRAWFRSEAGRQALAAVLGALPGVVIKRVAEWPKTYIATFLGVPVGSIGWHRPITTEVEGNTLDEARLALYDRFDHIHGLTLTEKV